MSDSDQGISGQVGMSEAAWDAVERFRENSELGEIRLMGFVVLFWKVISDRWEEKERSYRQRFGDDTEWIERRLSREPFVIPSGCGFHSLWKQRTESDLGERMNVALEQIEAANLRKLDGVFGVVDFADEAVLGIGRRRNRRLRCLLEAFGEPPLDFKRCAKGVAGMVCDFLVENFGVGAGPADRRAETPRSLAKLMAALLKPRSGMSVCDPFCGVGSVLREVERLDVEKGLQVFGQERDPLARAICRIHLYLAGLDALRIELGDSIREPLLLEGDHLMEFDTVVAHPTAPSGDWGHENAVGDRYQRFGRGLPPRSRGDFAIVLHMIQCAREGSGRVGVCLPHGVLFRGASEYWIRRRLLEENLVEAVIGLPPNLMYGRKPPLVILLFHRGKASTDVLFVDASRDFVVSQRRNCLADADIERIVEAYRSGDSRPGYAHRATMQEIAARDFSLNLAEYVGQDSEEDSMDLESIGGEIARLQGELAEVRSRLKLCFEEL